MGFGPKDSVNWSVTGPELLAELEGIVHFADGFAFYRTESPAGKALEEWINGARYVIAKATSAPQS